MRATGPRPTPTAGGKADEINPDAPIQLLTAGQSASGQTLGSAVSVYVISAQPRSIIDVTVERSGGDLDPKAFVYRGLVSARTNDFEQPTHGFFNSDSVLRAGWEMPSSFVGDLLLIVSASGDFTTEVACYPDSPGPCTDNGLEDELDTCEFVRESFQRRMEDEEDCDDFLSIEDTTQDDECCELWQDNGLPLEDFCG